MSKSSQEKKKKLLELFRESVKDEQEGGSGNKPTIQDVVPKSAHSTPYLSGANSACSSKRIMSEDCVHPVGRNKLNHFNGAFQACLHVVALVRGGRQVLQ
ncbi:hypothetical protein SESBI_13933 [Sesbania bispinosa]|nr:hypothetical protein SESBI_13933 [Sesbania bispinosa]